jgi:hypothetical protein
MLKVVTLIVTVYETDNFVRVFAKFKSVVPNTVVV